MHASKDWLIEIIIDQWLACEMYVESYKQKKV